MMAQPITSIIISLYLEACSLELCSDFSKALARCRERRVKVANNLMQTAAE